MHACQYFSRESIIVFRRRTGTSSRLVCLLVSLFRHGALAPLPRGRGRSPVFRCRCGFVPRGSVRSRWVGAIYQYKYHTQHHVGADDDQCQQPTASRSVYSQRATTSAATFSCVIVEQSSFPQLRSRRRSVRRSPPSFAPAPGARSAPAEHLNGSLGRQSRA